MKFCSVEECERATRSAGSDLCGTHYTAKWRAGRKGDCSVEGCDRGVQSVGMCGMHYQRVWHTGDPGSPTSKRENRTEAHVTRICGLCGEAKTEEQVNPSVWKKTSTRAWCKVCYRAYRFSTYSGVPLEQIQKFLASHEQRCAICGTEDDLVWDHCHADHVMRGFLCRNHNSMLGMAGDDPEILHAAIRYLAEATLID